jgi:CRP-like cAMP-binding protein/membrane protein YdbS with pleckstrin-like domain
MADPSAGPYADQPYLEPGAAIQQLNFLAGVSKPELIELFTDAVRDVSLHDRAVLCQQDATIDYVWLLLEGKISQFRRDVDPAGKPRQSLVREAEPGTLIGAYDFLFETTYRTRAIAVGACHLLAIDASVLSRLVFRFPDMRQRMAPLDTIGRLQTLPMVGEVEPVGLGFLADVLAAKDYKAGDVLYRSGDAVDRIYLLSQGQVELHWDSGAKNWVGNGTLLGLAHGAGASPAVTVTHDCVVSIAAKIFSVPRAAFITITGLRPDEKGLEIVAEREGIVDGMRVFAKFSELQRRQLIGFFSHNRYPTNHLLVQQNEAADSLWVVMPGSNAIIDAIDKDGTNMRDTVVTGPTYFAETALLGQIPQGSTVEADAGSEWLRLHWRDFDYFDVVDPADLRAKLQINSPKQPRLVGKEARKKYPWLMQGETVAYFSRRHWVAFLMKNFLTFIFIGLVIVFGIVGWALPGAQLWVVSTVILLLIGSGVALAWGITDYRNDWLVVTNRRVVYQEKLLFVNSWRKEAPLEQIQSVDFLRTLLGRWLGFGTLIVRTAGTAGEIRFNYTTNFDELRGVIKVQQDQRKQHASAQSKISIHRQLERRLGLMVEPPSRIAREKPPAPPKPQTWYSRIFGRQGIGIRWEEGNRIVWRKHWMALLPRIGWGWLTPFLIIILLAGWWALSTRQVPDAWEPIASVVQLLLGIFVLAFILRLAWVIVDWYNDTYEVSDSDVVNMRKLPFGLREDRRAAALARIQNVEMRIPSPIHWLFDYGNVVIQTAAEFGTLIFYSVPNPRAVADEILTRMDNAQRRQEEEEARRRAQDLPDWFEMYNRLEQGAVEKVRG